MDIKTKYSIEQTVYYVDNNKIKPYKIGSLIVKVKTTGSSGVQSFEINYYEGNTAEYGCIAEKSLYLTQEDALRTLLSADDFDKIIKEVAARTIDTWKNQK